MDAPNNPRSRRDPQTQSRDRFVAMLPAIYRAAKISFRNAPPELRAELTAEVLAAAFVMFTRLVKRGQQRLAFPSALSRFAIQQTRVGRRVGSRLRVGDLLSSYAQHQKQFVVERLDQYNAESEEWKELLVEDRRATPAETAASRIDFAEWLRQMPDRRRQIAKCLASGESTMSVARRFGITPARISQIRKEFRRSWSAFHGEPSTVGSLAAA